MSITSNEAIALLRPIGLFGDFSEAWLEAIYRVASYRDVGAGQYLVHEAEVSAEMFVILSGKLEIEVTTPGRPSQVVATLGEGEMLGELCLLGFERRSASAKASSAAGVLVWKKHQLESLFEAQPEMAYRFMQNLAAILSRRLITTNRELSDSFYHAIYES